jgi:hypothetical protein
MAHHTRPKGCGLVAAVGIRGITHPVIGRERSNEAIRKYAPLDCFIAALFAMTGKGEGDVLQGKREFSSVAGCSRKNR